MAKNPKPAPAAEPVEQKPVGIVARPLFTTVVEDAPEPKPGRLSAKTLAEQAAGVAQLRSYDDAASADTEE